MTKLLACIVCVLVVSGCASASVQRGALIGAGAGMLVGAGLGYAITDKKLLGSPSTKESGDVSIHHADGVLSGLAIGAVFGAIVGAMVGHRRDDDFELPKPAAPPAASASGSDTPTTAERDARQQQARAPYLRGL